MQRFVKLILFCDDYSAFFKLSFLFAFAITMTPMKFTITIIFSIIIIIAIFAVDGVTVERALVLVASEKGLAYWAYKWIHSPW